MTQDFTPLPRRRGRIEYRSTAPGREGALWGIEDWSFTRTRDGLRTLSAHCELELDGLRVARDSVQSVDQAFRPRDASVRLVVDDEFRGSAWYRFSDTEAECETFTLADGRISQRLPLAHPPRSFGTHALQADAWLTAKYDLSQGPGRQFFTGNLMCSTHHVGATGPFLMTTSSALEYVGDEAVEVPAGRFLCHHFRFVATANKHPPYDLWVSADGDYLFVLGIAGDYMAGRFELMSLE